MISLNLESLSIELHLLILSIQKRKIFVHHYLYSPLEESWLKGSINILRMEHNVLITINHVLKFKYILRINSTGKKIGKGC